MDQGLDNTVYTKLSPVVEEEVSPVVEEGVPVELTPSVKFENCVESKDEKMERVADPAKARVEPGLSSVNIIWEADPDVDDDDYAVFHCKKCDVYFLEREELYEHLEYTEIHDGCSVSAEDFPSFRDYVTYRSSRHRHVRGRGSQQSARFLTFER